MSGQVTLGVDVGQSVDPTAAVVVETDERVVEPAAGSFKLQDHYLVRHAETLPLGTPYPAVVDRLVAVIARLDGDVQVRVDATGVGKPVIDALRPRVPGVTVVAVHFVPGTKLVWRPDRLSVLMGKEYMAQRLMALFENGRIHIPEVAAKLRAELRDYELRVSRDGKVKIGTGKPGGHDDLVTGLGLAVLV